MLLLVTLFISLFISTFFGHAIHWSLHQRWSGVFNRAHLEHHLSLYPPGKLVSDRYRQAMWFHRGTLLFTPPLIVILGAACGLLWLVSAPLWLACVLSPVLVGYGLANDYVHDSTHIRKHWLNRFSWYKRVRKLHFIHHRDMTVNYGVITFIWDRVFGTIPKLTR